MTGSYGLYSTLYSYTFVLSLSLSLPSHGEKDLLDEMVDTKIRVSSADEDL